MFGLILIGPFLFFFFVWNSRVLFFFTSAAPGGWTKFLYRPHVMERIYAIDPGQLSSEVLALDTTTTTNIIRYIPTTIQQAIPDLVRELQTRTTTRMSVVPGTTTPTPYLDIWVSDMCVKDLRNQLEYFFLARQHQLVGRGTFFVFTIKCVIGYSSTAFEQQCHEQYGRLQPIAQHLHTFHLFYNRTSERTILGYLV